MDLLDAVLPGYLSAPKPSTADSLHYSPMFWNGMFTRKVNKLAATPRGRSHVSGAADHRCGSERLMEAAYRIVDDGCRRLLVIKDGDVVGIVREQDLFFEWARVMA